MEKELFIIKMEMFNIVEILLTANMKEKENIFMKMVFII